MASLNRVQFAEGTLDEPANELALAGIERPIVVTDGGIAAVTSARAPAVRAHIDPAGAIMVGDAPDVFTAWLAEQCRRRWVEAGGGAGRHSAFLLAGADCGDAPTMSQACRVYWAW